MKSKKKPQRKEFEEYYFLYSMNYQFLQFLPNTDVTLFDVSGRIVGPTLGPSGKTLPCEFSGRAWKKPYGDHRKWFSHNSKVFPKQADSVMLLCHILYLFFNEVLCQSLSPPFSLFTCYNLLSPTKGTDFYFRKLLYTGWNNRCSVTTRPQSRTTYKTQTKTTGSISRGHWSSIQRGC